MSDLLPIRGNDLISMSLVLAPTRGRHIRSRPSVGHSPLSLPFHHLFT